MNAAEKLVRDKMVETLRPDEYRIADESEMVLLLTRKLAEEVEEYVEAVGSGNEAAMLEELGDVWAVLMDLAWRVGPVSARAAMKDYEKGSFLRRVVLKLQAPVPMVLHCPQCKGKHIDRGIWATTRIHRSHLCEHCGHVWKPYSYATVGVEALPPLP